MNKINLVIVGLGNCASSLLQGLDYYKDSSKNTDSVPGLMHNIVGDYAIKDINVVGVYDVNKNKIGKIVNEAVWEKPNCTTKFSEVSIDYLKVHEAPLLDGLSPRMLGEIPNNKLEFDYELMQKTPWEQLETLSPVVKWKGIISKQLRDMKPDVIISYLPVGSVHATRFWAQMCIDEGIAFINAIPEFVCSTKKWSDKFAQAGLPCAGDDIKSQVGATIVHRVLTTLIDDRGQKILNTYQLNIGGNTDFQNMLDEHRLTSKRVSKTEAVTSITKQKFSTKIGPSDYIDHLKDNKVCYINFKGTQFGDVPFELDLKLSVEDSPNSAGCMIDVIRLLKLSLDRGLKGYQDFSSYFFKHPMNQYKDSKCYDIVKSFITNQT